MINYGNCDFSFASDNHALVINSLCSLFSVLLIALSIRCFSRIVCNTRSSLFLQAFTIHSRDTLKRSISFFHMYCEMINPANPRCVMYLLAIRLLSSAVHCKKKGAAVNEKKFLILQPATNPEKPFMSYS